MQFYSRVIKAVNDLEALLPAAQRANAATYLTAIIALAGYNAIPEADRRAGVQRLLDTGITTAMNHIGLQLFVAGLRSSIRDELMKNMPAFLWKPFKMPSRWRKSPPPQSLHLCSLESMKSPLRSKMRHLSLRLTQFQQNWHASGHAKLVGSSLDKTTEVDQAEQNQRVQATMTLKQSYVDVVKRRGIFKTCALHLLKRGYLVWMPKGCHYPNNHPLKVVLTKFRIKLAPPWHPSHKCPKTLPLPHNRGDFGHLIPQIFSRGCS